MREGDVVSARVTSVHEYGIYLEADGMIGFVQIPELSWDHDLEPNDVAAVGAPLEVRVLMVRDGRFSASIKRVRPDLDPWARAAQFDVGSEHPGTVTKVLDWCAMVDIGARVEGVIIEGRDGLAVGDQIRVVVIVCDTNLRKLQLSVLRV